MLLVYSNAQVQSAASRNTANEILSQPHTITLLTKTHEPQHACMLTAKAKVATPSADGATAVACYVYIERKQACAGSRIGKS